MSGLLGTGPILHNHSWVLGEGDPPPCDIEIICAYHLESGEVSMQYIKYIHKLQDILIICNI